MTKSSPREVKGIAFYLNGLCQVCQAKPLNPANLWVQEGAWRTQEGRGPSSCPPSWADRLAGAEPPPALGTDQWMDRGSICGLPWSSTVPDWPWLLEGVAPSSREYWLSYPLMESVISSQPGSLLLCAVRAATLLILRGSTAPFLFPLLGSGAFSSFDQQCLAGGGRLYQLVRAWW